MPVFHWPQDRRLCATAFCATVIVARMPYRLISALRLNMGRNRHGAIQEIIVNLNSEGGNRLKSGARPRPPKQRIVDLRPGDEILHEGRWKKVYGLEVFRELVLSDEEAERHAAGGSDSGWLVKAGKGYVSPITSGGLRRDSPKLG